MTNKEIPKKNSRVNLKKLAELANTTPATVSRALADKPSISEATKERIQKLARDYGYYPNNLARSVIKQESPFIGFIASDLRSEAYLQVFRELEGVAQSANKSILIADSQRQLEKEKKHIEYFLGMRICGLLLYPVSDWDRSINNSHIDQLIRANVPVIALGHIQRNGISTVMDEEWMSTGKLVRHLLKQGHQNFLIIDEGNTKNVPANQRRNAIISALNNEAGTDIHYETMISSEPDFTQKFLKKVRESKLQHIACISINDIIALKLYKIIQAAGFQVGQDISIAAFGSSDWAQHLNPGLTMSEPDVLKLVKQASTLLFDMIKNGIGDDVHNIIPQRLCIRESVRDLTNG